MNEEQLNEKLMSSINKHSKKAEFIEVNEKSVSYQVTNEGVRTFW